MDKDQFKKDINKVLGQKKIKNLIAVCIVLAFILIAMDVFSPGNNKLSAATTTKNNTDTTKIVNQTDENNYEENQKNDLKNILKKMNGVGDVEVMMTFESGEEKVPAYDKDGQKTTTEETDNQGGNRINKQDTDSSKVVMTTNDGNNEPFILTTYKPKIIGVMILAEGAENSKVKYEIQQAISKLYNLSLDKVNVYNMKK